MDGWRWMHQNEWIVIWNFIHTYVLKTISNTKMLCDNPWPTLLEKRSYCVIWQASTHTFREVIILRNLVDCIFCFSSTHLVHVDEFHSELVLYSELDLKEYWWVTSVWLKIVFNYFHYSVRLLTCCVLGTLALSCWCSSYSK
jgi:hypothetical protein